MGELLALSHLATVGLAATAAKLAPELAGGQYYSGCAIGFSAVLFAMKVVLSYRTPGWSHVAGFELPTKVFPGLLAHALAGSCTAIGFIVQLLTALKSPSTACRNYSALPSVPCMSGGVAWLLCQPD